MPVDVETVGIAAGFDVNIQRYFLSRDVKYGGQRSLIIVVIVGIPMEICAICKAEKEPCSRIRNVKNLNIARSLLIQILNAEP